MTFHDSTKTQKFVKSPLGFDAQSTFRRCSLTTLSIAPLSIADSNRFGGNGASGGAGSVAIVFLRSEYATASLWGRGLQRRFLFSHASVAEITHPTP
jgi:hypothetical protein